MPTIDATDSGGAAMECLNCHAHPSRGGQVLHRMRHVGFARLPDLRERLWRRRKLLSGVWSPAGSQRGQPGGAGAIVERSSHPCGMPPVNALSAASSLSCSAI